MYGYVNAIGLDGYEHFEESYNNQYIDNMLLIKQDGKTLIRIIFGDKMSIDLPFKEMKPEELTALVTDGDILEIRREQSLSSLLDDI